MIYFFAFSFFLFGCFNRGLFYKNVTRYNEGIYYYIFWLIVIVIAALRYRIAPDTVWYMTYFEEEVRPISELTWNSLMTARYQPLWTIFASIFKSFGSYYIFQAAHSILLGYLFSLIFIKTTRYAFLSSLIFLSLSFFYFFMDILRESLAVSFFIFSIMFFDKRKNFYGILFFVFAVMTHAYSVLLFPMCAILYFRLRLNIIFAIFIVSLFSVYFFFEDIFQLLVSNYFFSGFEFYSSLVNNEMSLAGYLYNFLRVFPIILIMVYYRKNEIEGLFLSKRTVFVGCAFYCLFVVFRIFLNPYAERFTNYFLVFPILLFCSWFYMILSFFEKTIKII